MAADGAPRRCCCCCYPKDPGRDAAAHQLFKLVFTHNDIPASNFRMAPAPGLPWRGASGGGNENKEETAIRMHAADGKRTRGV